MIRKAVPNDLDKIEEIYMAIHTEEEKGLNYIGWNRAVYPTRKTAEIALTRGDIFVYEVEGIVVASAIINQIQVPEYADCPWEYTANDDEVMVLHTLTVAPMYSGRGIGSSFVDFYEKYASENGCSILRMDTNEKNLNARKLYAKLGYKESGIVLCEFNGIPNVRLVCLEKKL